MMNDSRKRVLKIMKRKLWVKMKSNGGETMIETIMSFVILTIIMLALGGMILFSSHLRMRAEDVSKVCSSFYKEIYKTTPNDAKVEASYYIGKHADDRKTMFMLKVSSETTNANLGINNSNERAAFTDNSIRIPNIDATGYKSEEPEIDSENLVRPSVLIFRYNKDPILATPSP